MEGVHLSGELLILWFITIIFGYMYIDWKKRGDSILVQDDLALVWRQPMYMQFFRKQRYDEQVEAPVIIEVGNQIVYANDAALEMLGAKFIDQLVGKSVQAFIVPTLQMEFGKRKQEGTLHFFECEMMCCDGTRVIVQMVGVDTEFEGERAVQLILWDVTEKHRAVHQIIEEKKQLESFFTMSADAMCILNLDRTVVQVNEAFENLFGYTEEELRGKVIPDVFRFTVEELQERIKQLEAGNVVHGLEVFAEKSNKERVPVSLTVSPILDEQGQLVMISGVARDIKMQKMYEQALLESQHHYRMIAENLHDYILMLSKDLVITYMSPSIRNALELDLDELIGRHCFNMIAEMDLPAVQEKIDWMIQQKDSIMFEYRVRNKQSEYVWVETRMIPVLNEQKDIDYFIASMKNISDRKDYQVQLEKLAFSDSLTGVANRHAFEGHLKSRIESKEPFALFYLDFDKLKWINDSFSHECGDLFLKEAVQRVRKAVRSSDFIARLGGDEFAIIVENAQEEELELVARRIVRAFHEPFQYEDHSFVSTVSIGIALYPRDGKDYRTLVLHADEALYYVKENGRNNYRFHYQTVQLDMQKRLEQDFPSALSKGQLYLAYQPQVDLQSGSLVGMEALLRWRHPELGLVNPTNFIPFAEDEGRIFEVTSWVLERACLQMKHWNEKYGMQMKVGVNISPIVLERAGFVEAVRKVLKSTQFDPRLLVLEVTETGLIHNMENSKQVLDELCELEIMIAIDDFGTGFSSLHHIRNLPIRLLKIDQSYIQNMETDMRDAKLVDTIIYLANSLNMTVMAEGVENEKQLELLKKLDCAYIQGYYFSSPLLAAEAEAWMEQFN